MDFIATYTWSDFLDAVELLLCSSFCFLDKLLTISFLQYLQPVSNKQQCPKWACFTYCTHAESSYLTAKHLPQAICRSLSDHYVKRILINFHDTLFSQCINFPASHSSTKFRRTNYFANTKVAFNCENFAPRIFQEVRYTLN